jgi:hypothetical protein
VAGLTNDVRSAIDDRRSSIEDRGSFMPDVATERFTVGVFQDVAWAERGIEALRRHDFPPEALSIIAKTSPETEALVAKTLGAADRMTIKNIGEAVLRGALVAALQGEAADLATLGIGATMRRVGFQRHDGFIFETLTARGGVLVAVRSEVRAADALAALHAYGGGNAAIGAWTGRV